MSKFDNVQPPKQFQYKTQPVRIKNFYEFKCDNRIYFSQTMHKDLTMHTYKFDIEILSPIDDYGLALDFNVVDKIYKQHLAPYLDKQLLNETLPDMNTTAENIAFWIWEQFELHLPTGNTLEKLNFYENATQGLVLTND